jgi:DNA-directed RNA polymerase beta subunit
VIDRRMLPPMETPLMLNKIQTQPNLPMSSISPHLVGYNTCVTRFIPSVIESVFNINASGHTLKAENVRVVPNAQTSPEDCVRHNQTLFADVLADVTLDGNTSNGFVLFQIPAMIGSVVDPFPCDDPLLIGTFICNGNRIFLPLTQRLPYNRIIVIKNEATLRSEHVNLHRSTSTLKVAAKVPRGGSMPTLQVSIPWYKKTLDVSVIVNAMGFRMAELSRDIALFSQAPEFSYAPETSEHMSLATIGACFITKPNATTDDLIAKGRLQVLNEILPHLTSFGTAEKLRMLAAMCGTALAIMCGGGGAVDDAPAAVDEDGTVEDVPDAAEMPVPWYDDTGETLATHVRVKLKDAVNKCSSNIYKKVKRAADPASVNLVLTQLISASKLTRTIVMSFTTGTWVKRKGISEQLSTENTPASSAVTFMLRKVVNPVCKRGQQIAHRSVNKTSIGRTCPVSTPDGEGVGLKSTLAASASVSQLDPDHMVQAAVDLVLEPSAPSAPSAAGSVRYFDMFGRWRGWVSDVHERVAVLQMRRRAGQLPAELGFELTNNSNLYVTMSRGRLLRPILHRTSGIIEMLDAAEETTLCTVAFTTHATTAAPGTILHTLQQMRT